MVHLMDVDRTHGRRLETYLLSSLNNHVLMLRLHLIEKYFKYNLKILITSMFAAMNIFYKKSYNFMRLRCYLLIWVIKGLQYISKTIPTS
jgi:hypothetical protein